MQISELIVPFPAVDLKQALTDIIDSIAVEGKAFGHILDAESKILDSIRKDANDVEEFAGFNISFNSIIRSITTLKLFNYYELEDAENLLQRIVDLSDYDEEEE